MDKLEFQEKKIKRFFQSQCFPVSSHHQTIISLFHHPPDFFIPQIDNNTDNSLPAVKHYTPVKERETEKERKKAR